MKKRKFFSYLFLGLLTIGSTGMVTSCKDYDDDIDQNKSDINALQQQLSTLQTALQSAQSDATAAAGAAATATTTAQQALALAQAAATQEKVDQIQAAIDSINELLNGKVDQSTYDAKVAEIAAQITAINDSLNTLNSGVKDEETARKAAVADLQSQINALSTYADLLSKNGTTFEGLIQQVKNTAAQLETIKNDVSANSTTVNDLKVKMQDADSKLNTLDGSVKSLKANIDVLSVLINKYLTSLVFKPEFYLEGIEAMGATTLQYDSVKLDNNSTAAKPLADGETLTQKGEGFATPLVTASYHMNPSTVDIKNFKEVSFISDDKDYIMTRATELKPVVHDFDAKDGLLNIHFQVNAGAIQELSTKNPKVTVLAAQVKYSDGKKDTTITSDYAAIYKRTVKNILIADSSSSRVNAPETDLKAFHVYKTAKEAIDGNYTHTLVWNSKSGIDLKKLVVAHYTTDANKEAVLNNVANYGLKWEFAPSHYKSGNNNTSESVHINLNNGIATACMPNDAGTAPSDVQNKASIDREPLVRVVLRDTVNNRNVAVGFIKLKIIDKKDEETNPAPVELTFDNNAGINLNCTGYSRELSWVEIENQILAKLNNGQGMSKEDFEQNNYTYEDGKYWTSSDGGKTWTETTGIKTVEYTNTDTEGHQTNILTWKVSAQDLYNAVWDATKKAYKSGQVVKATVKFASKNPKVNPDIYVTFKSGVIATPTASWDKSANGIANYWAALNSTLGTGYDEIHENVDVYGQTDANCEFKRDLLATINNKNNIKITDPTGFADFANSKLKYSFKFETPNRYKTLKGQSGETYTMSVSADGLTLNATDSKKKATQAVAVLSGNENNASNNTIEYQKTDYAKDILNAYSHIGDANDNHNATAYANVPGATIGLYAVNSCNMELPLANNTFDVKFLRPLNASTKDNNEVIDGKDNGNKITVANLVNLSDWRDQWEGTSKIRTKTTVTSDTYANYYQVESITADVAAATTNLDGGTLGTTKLSDITSKTKFTTPDNGATISYENNGQVTSTFVVRIPVTVKYKWGELTKAYVDITVRPTVENPAKRH